MRTRDKQLALRGYSRDFGWRLNLPQHDKFVWYT